jgi:Ca2+-binding RTX toxin-like protein
VQAEPSSPVASVVVRAGAGEANRVTLTRAVPRTVQVSDGGAVLAPSAGCAAVDVHNAVCTIPGTATRVSASVDAGDGDDSVSGRGLALTANGGPGDDRITGAKDDDSLRGGQGDDHIAGGPGDDFLDGERGADQLRAGAGNDVVIGRRGGADDIGCGPQDDVVAGSTRRDLIRRGCEEAQYGHLVGMTVVPHPRRIEPAAVTFRLLCSESFQLDGERLPIAGAMLLRRAGGRQLGHGRIPAAAGARCGGFDPPSHVDVPVALNDRGRRVLARGGGALVEVSLRGRNVPDSSWAIRLRVPD